MSAFRSRPDLSETANLQGRRHKIIIGLKWYCLRDLSSEFRVGLKCNEMIGLGSERVRQMFIIFSNCVFNMILILKVVSHVAPKAVQFAQNL